MKNQKISVVALLLGASLAEVSELQQKQDDGLLDEEQILLELEHITGQKELAELEEDIDIMDKQNFDFREYPTTEEYLMQDLSEKFGSDDEEMDNELLINLEQMNDISDSYESDSESNSDDEDLQLDDEELLQMDMMDTDEDEGEDQAEEEDAKKAAALPDDEDEEAKDEVEEEEEEQADGEGK